MSPAKWEAEYTVEHTGTGMYWVSFRENRGLGLEAKRYIEECKRIGMSLGCYKRLYSTVESAEYAAKLHAKQQVEMLKAGTVAKELGKLP